MSTTVVKMNFDVDIARELNVNAAIIFSNIQYWVFINAQKGINEHEGKFWTYNSYTDFQVYFIWLSIKQIRDAVKKLEISGLLEVGEFNKDNRDRTKWYTPTSAYALLPKGQPDRRNRQASATKSSGSCDEIVSSYKEHIINTDDKPYMGHTENSSLENLEVNNSKVVTPSSPAPEFASDWMIANCLGVWQSAWMQAPAPARVARQKVIDHFNSKVLTEQLNYNSGVLYGRLLGVMNNWKASNETSTQQKRKILA
jgi:hypothetical protein